MRKGLLVLLAMALVVALAVPASAEMKLNGFYRVKPTVSNFVGRAGNAQLNRPGMESDNNAAALVSLRAAGITTGVETDRSAAWVEMRNRLRFEIGDENVKGVTFFELDGNFGDTGGATGRNQGFASNGDSINLETKNAFLWFRLPNTPFDFTVGLQGYTDEFAGLLFGASDQAAIVANFKGTPVAVRLTWLKIRDFNAVVNATPANNAYGGIQPGDGDATYYAADVKFNPTKEVSVTAHAGFIHDASSFISEPAEAAGLEKMNAYYLGANATFKLVPVSLTFFGLYNFGTFEDDTANLPDVDIEGYAAALRADFNLGPGKLFAEGLYVSGDDDPATTTKYKSIITGSDYANLTSYYARPDLQILFPNADMINSATALVLNPNNSGRGLILVAAGYSQKFGDRLSGKVGAGYLAADKKRPASAATSAQGKDMGIEVNANLNYNITKGLDFGVYGAYCFLGDFYSRPAGQSDPEDLYNLLARLNFAF